MLKLKSIVKTREQLLATGWTADQSVAFSNTEVHRGFLYVMPEMLGRQYNGVIKDYTYRCTLEGVSDIWTLHPEMMLIVDQWGFARDPETLEILMWDADRGGARVIKEINLTRSYSILTNSTDGKYSDRYTKNGFFYRKNSTPLSKYPYSTKYGGYTPFDFDELKEAFNCEKVAQIGIPSELGDSTESESKGEVEVTAESQVKDESGVSPLEDMFGEKEMQIWTEISTIERVTGLLERLENLRSSDLPGVKEKVEAVMLDMVKKLVV